MNKRILKLVNDERKSLTIRSAKGCAPLFGGLDACSAWDFSNSCSLEDICYKDFAGCGSYLSDWCEIDTVS